MKHVKQVTRTVPVKAASAMSPCGIKGFLVGFVADVPGEWCYIMEVKGCVDSSCTPVE